LGVEHISAYALIVEAGTKLERKIRSGEIVQVDDDLLAEKYEYASEMFETSGFDWYEISNWGVPSIHNQAYWKSMDWWGYGPGAHSHISGTRWWNRKHPIAYRDSVQNGTPAQAYEEVSKGSIAEERLLLELRTQQGVSKQVLKDLGIPPAEVARFIGRGLIEPKPGNRIAVTKAGRLLADGIVLELLSSAEV
jgi:oxygen-independent coproporphyrinogen-3 oxidase